MQGLSSTTSTGTLQAISGQGSTLQTANLLKAGTEPPQSETFQTFQKFVAETFYGQMLKSLHAMHDKPAYFHGGQAEELFQGQLDQVIAGQMAEQHGAVLAEPLFDAFQREVQGPTTSRNISEAYGSKEDTATSSLLDTQI